MTCGKGVGWEVNDWASNSHSPGKSHWNARWVCRLWVCPSYDFALPLSGSRVKNMVKMKLSWINVNARCRKENFLSWRSSAQQCPAVYPRKLNLGRRQWYRYCRNTTGKLSVQETLTVQMDTWRDQMSSSANFYLLIWPAWYWRFTEIIQKRVGTSIRAIKVCRVGVKAGIQAGSAPLPVTTNDAIHKQNWASPCCQPLGNVWLWCIINHFNF